jgi:hypothetical protein
MSPVAAPSAGASSVELTLYVDFTASKMTDNIKDMQQFEHVEDLVARVSN